MIGFFIALLSGALMSVQGVFNTQVTKTTGVWVSNGWVQLTAFAVCLVVWLATGRDSIAALGKVEPRYMRSRYYVDGDQEHRCSGPGQIRSSHCDRTARRVVCDRTFRTFWHGQRAF